MFEKRLRLRKDWKTEVTFEDEFNEPILFCYSRDISLGGLALDDCPNMKLGSHLFLSFNLPNYKRPMKLVGQMVRFVEKSDDSSQILRAAGVRFVDLDTESFKKLAEFLQE